MNAIQDKQSSILANDCSQRAIVKLSFSYGKENIGTDFQASWLKSVVSIISNNHCVLKLEITKV